MFFRVSAFTISTALLKCAPYCQNSCVSNTTQRNASLHHLDMTRILLAAFSITASALQMKVQHTAKLRALSRAHAVSCAEADALRAQAKHLRTVVEIEERQLNALRADAAPHVAVDGKNNILPLERLKTWRTRLSFEGNRVVSASWTKFHEGGRAELDGCEVDGDGCDAGWSLSETARTAPTGAKLLECWFKKGGKTYKLKTRAFPRAEVEKLLRIEQDAFDLIEKLRTKLTKAEAALADAKSPLDMIPRAFARMHASDELDMSYLVQKSCQMQADPVRVGHFVDLDGVSYKISNAGEVEEVGSGRGSFSAYVTKQR